MRVTTSSFGARWRVGMVATLVVLLCGTGCEQEALPVLPKLKIDPDRIAVFGLSSGAYMATQAHLAFSDHLIGAALVAGGPYGCAQADLDIALSRCMKGVPGIDVAALAQTAVSRAQNKQIAPLTGLSGDRVMLLHGTLDQMVAANVSQAAGDFYGALNALPEVENLQITSDATRAFAHTFPTQATGSDCTVSESPYLGRCGFDAAGWIMQGLFGDRTSDAPATKADALPSAAGELIKFDQDAYRVDGNDANLDAAGFLYVPDVCAQPNVNAPACGLLVAFHGCQQSVAQVGETFARDAGFNRWAAQMRVVVLYPQTRASYLPLNPKACWDWWGYSGVDYDTQNGAQLRWLAKASAALGATLK